MPIAYATLAGITPMALGFLAGFFRLPFPNLTWGAYLAWLVGCLIVGAIVTIAQKR